MIDWNDLRYLLAVGRARTLAGAARELGVEHTTVGRRITALETTLGTRLFTRGPDGFTPTRAAEEVLPIATEIAERIDAIERRVAGEDARVEGTVRLTMSEAVSGYFAKHSSSLREIHPALIVEMLSGNRAYDLMRGEADIAIRIIDTIEPDLVARKLATAGWAMYATPSYLERKGTPSNAEDLSGHDVIAFDKSLSITPGALWLHDHEAGTNVVARANSIVAAMNMAMLGMGLAILPCFIAGGEPTLTRVAPRVLGSRSVFLVAHPDLVRVARVRAVMDFIVEMFTKDASAWSGALSEGGGQS